MTIIKKDFLNKIIIVYKTDLINHIYFIFFNIQNLDQQLKQPERKTYIFNAYKERVEQVYTQIGNIFKVKQALKYIKQKSIKREKFLITRDINAYSLIQNFYYHIRQSAIFVM